MRKKNAGLVLGFIAVMLLTGCGGSNKSAMAEEAYSTYESAPAEMKEEYIMEGLPQRKWLTWSLVTPAVV